MDDSDIVNGLKLRMQTQQNFDRDISRGFQIRMTPCMLTGVWNFKLTFVNIDVHPDQQGIH